MRAAEIAPPYPLRRLRGRVHGADPDPVRRRSAPPGHRDRRPARLPQQVSRVGVAVASGQVRLGRLRVLVRKGLREEGIHPLQQERPIGVVDRPRRTRDARRDLRGPGTVDALPEDEPRGTGPDRFGEACRLYPQGV